MKHIKDSIYVVIICLYSADAQARWQFSDQFVQQQKQSQSTWKAPEVATAVPQSPQPPVVIKESRSAYLINGIAIIYMLVQLYYLYEEIYGPPNPELIASESFFMKFLKILHAYLCPTIVTSLGNTGRFFIRALVIGLETLIYKSLVRLLLFCAQKDAFDLFRKQRIA